MSQFIIFHWYYDFYVYILRHQIVKTLKKKDETINARFTRHLFNGHVGLRFC